jgi:hypothetical protein
VRNSIVLGVVPRLDQLHRVVFHPTEPFWLAVGGDSPIRPS